jgi:hypothetical protein
MNQTIGLRERIRLATEAAILREHAVRAISDGQGADQRGDDDEASVHYLEAENLEHQASELDELAGDVRLALADVPRRRQRAATYAQQRGWPVARVQGVALDAEVEMILADLGAPLDQSGCPCGNTGSPNAVDPGWLRELRAVSAANPDWQMPDGMPALCWDCRLLADRSTGPHGDFARAVNFVHATIYSQPDGRARAQREYTRFWACHARAA